MEIKLAFRILFGILMILTVIVSTVSFMGSLSAKSVFIEKCIPSEYTATTTSSNTRCGFNPSGQSVYCNNDDDCMDPSVGKNICCPTSQENITIFGDSCCNVTALQS